MERLCSPLCYAEPVRVLICELIMSEVYLSIGTLTKVEMFVTPEVHFSLRAEAAKHTNSSMAAAGERQSDSCLISGFSSRVSFTTIRTQVEVLTLL